MLFCPRCRYEYREGIDTCPDCEVELVDELPPEPDREKELGGPPEDFVPLANLTAEAYATMIGDALSEANIPAEVVSGTGYFGKTGQMGPSSYRPIEGAVYTVWVHKDSLDDADLIGEGVLGEDWDAAKIVNREEQ